MMEAETYREVAVESGEYSSSSGNQTNHGSPFPESFCISKLLLPHYPLLGINFTLSEYMNEHSKHRIIRKIATDS